ncbi:hypothetical protein EW146_g498 [Bondarzewia mesenterica]|uniref:DAGKc domain-containing protein n=1 Tax=Bondarzewia mesenterica TaxID=1095465 RepID=A0A4S4M6Z2_9AGAM|nr:hypothetical protein EW146_g498 [Bondarzewia mesenterica]
MPLLVLYNPVSGSASGKQITEHRVLPLLAEHHKIADQISSTEHAGHAGQLVLDFIDAHPTDGEGTLDVILVSGDGTLHEIVNALHDARAGTDKALPKIRLALVAAGTANALYSSLFPSAAGSPLFSLAALLSPSPHLVSLTLALTTLLPPSSHQTAPTSVISAVVTSTSLHASILHDSETLRQQMPGIERFKVAAQQNATRWYAARAHLLPPVQRSKGPLRTSSPPSTSTGSSPRSASPRLRRAHPPSEDAIDVVVVRPSRDPSVRDAGEEARARFADKAWKVLGGAYEDGKHVRLRYNVDGEIVEEGDGVPVVEYFRVGGWEWIPDEADERAHLVCADGAIFTIPKGGRASSQVLSRTSHNVDFAVYT